VLRDAAGCWSRRRGRNAGAAGKEDPAVAPGYEQLHQAWLEHGPGPVQELVASIILGPGRQDGWYARWNEQYAQWAPDDLGQLAWPFRCLMDRDDITARLAGITCPMSGARSHWCAL
jgi:hypothetical protein